MRTLLGGLAAGLLVLCPALPAHADGAGQIEHVEVAPDGTVSMLYSLPELADGVTTDLDSVRVEVAGKPVEATASPAGAGTVERSAVLALDISDSMSGERFAAAKQAAAAYLQAVPDDVSVGLVTFAGSVDVVDPATTDHDRLLASVNELQLSRGTLLYDGILEAVDVLGGEGQRQVVVLSDGADTGETALTDVIATAKRAGVTVDVVALEQSTANRGKLRQITDATGGAVLSADDPAALQALFERQADALAEQVLIEFASPSTGEATVTTSLQAGGETYSDSTFVALTSSSAGETDHSGTPLAVEPPATVLGKNGLFAGLAAIAIGLGAVVVAVFSRKPKEHADVVQRQLAFYSSQASDGRPLTGPHMPKSHVDVRGSAVAVADQIVKSGGLEARINQRLTAAGLSLTAAEWLLLHAGVAVGAGFVGMLLSGGNPLVMAVGLLGGVIAPWLFLGMKETRRLKAFNSQLADTLQLMSGGLSAGLSMPQAVDTVVREGTEPMAGELRRALIEQRLGVDIEDALDGVAGRMQSKDFSWVVMAIRIQREIGGNLAELLNTVAATIREREYLRRQVRTLSAEGRLSAWILGALPPVFLGYLLVTRPDYLAPLYTTSIGLILSVGGVGLLGVGSLWLKSIVKVEV